MIEMRSMMEDKEYGALFSALPQQLWLSQKKEKKKCTAI